VLGVTARGDSWVQVLDAQGQFLLSRVVVQGETVSLDGALPLKVVVGRVDQTEVSVRGKPFSMADIAQGNVARFEVK
jgi:cytoskeleton protein RodZ